MQSLVRLVKIRVVMPFLLQVTPSGRLMYIFQNNKLRLYGISFYSAFELKFKIPNIKIVHNISKEFEVWGTDL